MEILSFYETLGGRYSAYDRQADKRFKKLWFLPWSTLETTDIYQVI